MVLLLHLVNPDPVEPLVVVYAAGVVVDGQGAQRHVHAVQPDVDPDVGVDLVLGEGAVRRGDAALRAVPPGPMLTD